MIYFWVIFQRKFVNANRGYVHYFFAIDQRGLGRARALRTRAYHLWPRVDVYVRIKIKAQWSLALNLRLSRYREEEVSALNRLPVESVDGHRWRLGDDVGLGIGQQSLPRVRDVRHALRVLRSSRARQRLGLLKVGGLGCLSRRGNNRRWRRNLRIWQMCVLSLVMRMVRLLFKHCNHLNNSCRPCIFIAYK